METKLTIKNQWDNNGGENFQCNNTDTFITSPFITWFVWTHDLNVKEEIYPDYSTENESGGQSRGL